MKYLWIYPSLEKINGEIFLSYCDFHSGDNDKLFPLHFV